MDKPKQIYDLDAESAYPDSARESGDLEGTFLEGSEDDSRLGNSVPPEHRGSNLDFIMMSGVTAPPQDESPPAELRASHNPDMDPDMPVSFFEKGVDDVDSSMGPLAMERTTLEEDEILVKSRAPAPAGSAVASLKEIVAEMSGEAPEAQQVDTVVLDEEPEGFEISHLDLPELEQPADIEIEEEIAAVSVETDEIASLMQTLEPPPEEESREVEEQVFHDEIEVLLDDEVETYAAPESPPQPVVQAAAVALMEAPAAPRAAPAPVTGTENLAQAERLLHRLEAQQDIADTALLTDPHVFLKDWIFPDQKDPEDVVYEEDDQDADGERPARRRSRGRRGVRRRMARWALRALVLVAVCVGLYEAYQFYLLETATDRDAYRRARQLVESGDHLKGAESLEAFLQNYPDSPLRADALFLAAYALHLVPDTDARAAAAYEDATLRFQQFAIEYPDHEKRARAETLLGIMYYRTEDYRNAILTLRDSNRRKSDPGAYVPALRVLARAYAATGELENAHSAFTQAASTEDNIAPDQDYIELAGLYEKLADRANEAETRNQYLKAAVDQWDRALRVPGVLQTRRKDVRIKRDAVARGLERDGYRRPEKQNGAPMTQTPIAEISEEDQHELTEQQLLYVD